MKKPLHKRLTKELLKFLAEEVGLTDKEIARLFRVDRTTITHQRKDFGIAKKDGVGRQGELFVLEQLCLLGLDALDMNEKDRLSLFDILVDDSIRIDVKTSKASKKDGKYQFAFSEHVSNGNKVGEYRVKMKNGRMRKLYRKTCDFLILVMLDEKICYIIPSRDIPDKIGGIGLYSHSKAYRQYREKWELLGLPLKKAL